TMTTLNVTGNGTVSGTLGVNGTMNAATVQQSGSTLVPPGTIMAYAGTSAPAGWLECNGQQASRTVFANLFNAIGTNYGAGDGSTTFNLPDLTGRTIFGKEASQNRITAAGSGITSTSIGNAGGAETHTLTTSEIPTHTHANTLNDPGHAHTLPVSTLYD